MGKVSEFLSDYTRAKNPDDEMAQDQMFEAIVGGKLVPDMDEMKKVVEEYRSKAILFIDPNKDSLMIRLTDGSGEPVLIFTTMNRGESTSVNLNKQQAKQLAAWLNKWADK